MEKSHHSKLSCTRKIVCRGRTDSNSEVDPGHYKRGGERRVQKNKDASLFGGSGIMWVHAIPEKFENACCENTRHISSFLLFIARGFSSCASSLF